MQRMFYAGLLGLILFELANIYFIMPMPGSQRMNSLDLAYFLHHSRWYFRSLAIILMLAGLRDAIRKKPSWLPFGAILVGAFIIYKINFSMAADHMFRLPGELYFLSREESTLSDSSLVLGIDSDGEAKAYPIRYLVYHHQVRDTIGHRPVMITYCSVCRTGRVFEPLVNGRPEDFRLVGMDHFNAMFEDHSTKSWWRQVNGEAVAGPLKGAELPEFPSSQLSLGKFFEQYPAGKVMKMDQASKSEYDSLARFEYGRSTSKLTGTDSLSWMNKSWVIGIEVNSVSRAYDWNQLKEERIIHDVLDQVPIVLVLGDDNQSFMAFRRPSHQSRFKINNDVLLQDSNQYDLFGVPFSPGIPPLEKIDAYQEFWHSWKTFHPETDQYPEN